MRGSVKVASGILLSRLAGFVREAVLAAAFGVGPHGDVLRTALRGPNLLQNLLGEQSLSASFIPVYSQLLARGREEDAGRFAGAVFGLLLALAGALSLIGVLLAEPIVAVLAPGYLADAQSGAVDRFPLAVTAVRILFPMTGILVLSAWALGVLNSHRRLFLPYFAPVLWNASIIAATVWVIGESGGLGEARADRILVAACVGALAGGALQFLVQVPAVARVMRGFRFSLSIKTLGVPEALRTFGPLLLGRGAVQLSAYLDLILASLLAVGAVGALGWAQTLYILPIGLFGVSIAAAELPELAREMTGEGAGSRASGRLDAAMRQMAFLTLPTVAGYLVLGHLLVGLVYRRGNFGAPDQMLVYLVLAAYTIGLFPTTWARLLNNTFYAMKETVVPARIAAARVAVSAGLGLALMWPLDRVAVSRVSGTEPAGEELFLGALGLAIGAAVGSWLELLLLHRALRSRLPAYEVPLAAAGRMAMLAAAALLPAAAVWWLARGLPAAAAALLVVGCYAASYLGSAALTRQPELRIWLTGLSGVTRREREGE